MKSEYFMKDDYRQRIVQVGMVLTLLVGFTYSFIIEQIPGAGWDGILYRDFCNNFLGMLRDGEISAYYIQKCLPFAIVNVICTTIGISASYEVLIVLHYIALLFSIVAFFKISKYFHLKTGVELIAFSLTFFSFFYLKKTGYYPYSGDAFAYCLSLWFFYYFVSKQSYKMLGVALAGAFLWQSMLPLAVILFALPREGYNLLNENIPQKDARMLTISKRLMMIMIAVILPSTILALASMHGGIQNWSSVIPYSYFELPLWVIFLSTICLSLLIYFALKPLSFSIVDFCKFTFTKIRWKRVAIALGIFIFMKVVICILSNPDMAPPITTRILIRRVLWEPYILPVKFFSTHLAMCGLLVPLFIVLYKDVLKYVSSHSVGYIAALVMILIFGLQSETRYVLNFIPFIVFPIVKVLSEKDIKFWVPIVVYVFQLFFSGIWYHINTPEYLASVETTDVCSFLSGPAQRWDFHNGPWQGLKAYTIFISQFIVIMTLLLMGQKRKWFVKQ